MIADVINRIEKADTIENVALKYHHPVNATYVIVDKDFKFKIISKDRFSFNSKYVVMDFYSQLINLNKAVDTKKLITSNNYSTFFCKKVDKLTMEIIDNYYKKLETPDNWLIYRDWVKENIFKISESVDKKETIKIFFINDIEKYIDLGRNYFKNKALSNITKIDKEEYGNSLFINLNDKKPFLRTQSRKTTIPHLINKDEALKDVFLYFLLYSFAKLKHNILYVLGNGELIPLSAESGELPKRNFINGLFLRYDINKRGNLDILEMDIIAKYDTHL